MCFDVTFGCVVDVISQSELHSTDADRFSQYVQQFSRANPIKLSRHSKQTWIHPDSTTDPIYKRIQRR